MLFCLFLPAVFGGGITTKTTTTTGSGFFNDPLFPYNFGPTQPQQAHLSFFPPSNIGLVWNTNEICTCTVSSTPASAVTTEEVTKFVDEGSLKRTQYVHFVQFQSLTPGQFYSYEILCPGETGSFYSNFTMLREDAPQRMLVVGDVGLRNFQSYERLLSEAASGLWDVILHDGDFAYDMDDNNGTRGDAFMNLMQPITSRFPYMVSEGNHEEAYNFLHYRMRFRMPGSWESCIDCTNAFFSWNWGLVHFITYSTEILAYPEQWVNIPAMEAFLVKDLEEANQNRDKQPWIVAMGHRPMYCSNDDGDCGAAADVNRAFFEKIFCDGGVDIVLEAHEHTYERSFPVWNGKVMNGTGGPYTNPLAPVHFINGCAGNQERHDPFLPQPDWSAFRAQAKYGYGHLTIFNATHAYWEQMWDKTAAAIDSLWLVQEDHGPFACPWF